MPKFQRKEQSGLSYLSKVYVSNIKVYKHKIVQPHIPLIHSHIPLSFVILADSTLITKCLVCMVDYRGNLFLNQLAKKQIRIGERIV